MKSKNRSPFFIALILFFIMVTFVGCEAGAGEDKNDSNARTEIYVSTTGNDNSDGSMEQPLKSISKALTIVDSSKGATIYVASGTYSDIVTITATVPITIKGGYNTSWIRSNKDDKSTIDGGEGKDHDGHINTKEGSKVTLENLDIKGAIYDSGVYKYAYGVKNSGDMTVDNCDIIMVESGTLLSVFGFHNDANSRLSIIGGTITGAAGDSEVTTNVCGIYNYYGTLIVSGAAIRGAVDNVTANSISGISNFSGTATIVDTTIVGTTDNTTVGSATGNTSVISIDGVYTSGGTTTISGCTITAATGDTAVVTNVSSIYNHYGTTTIKSGTIAGSAGTTTVSNKVYGVINNGTLSIEGGTIVGASESSSAKDSCGVSNSQGTAIISNCTIYGKTTATVTSTIEALFKNGTAPKFIKGDAGPAVIQEVKGTDPNLWTTDFTWDTP